MARPRKEQTTSVYDCPPIYDTALEPRIAQLEADVARLAGYIAERDQIRPIGADADIIGIVRRHKG